MCYAFAAAGSRKLLAHCKPSWETRRPLIIFDLFGLPREHLARPAVGTVCVLGSLAGCLCRIWFLFRLQEARLTLQISSYLDVHGLRAKRATSVSESSTKAGCHSGIAMCHCGRRVRATLDSLDLCLRPSSLNLSTFLSPRGAPLFVWRKFAVFLSACGARPEVLEEIAKISRKLEEEKQKPTAIVHYNFVFTAGLQGWALRYRPVFGCCCKSFRVVPRKDRMTPWKSSVMLLQRPPWDSYHLVLCFSW